MQGLVGIVLILAVSWAISEERHAIQWRPVVAGVALAVLLALALLKIPGVREAVLGEREAAVQYLSSMNADISKAVTAARSKR